LGALNVGNTNQARLRDQLVENYDGLIARLTRRLGSSDFAHEALHETFLRLDRVTDAAPVRSPPDFLFRIAINVAKDRHRAQTHRLGASEVDALLDVCDNQPDAARVVEARSEIAAFKSALAELPERPRRVLQDISIEGATAQEVADRLQIGLRTVENDLKLALLHCANALGRTVARRLGGPRLRW
jgi:RNA polymerase sigma-70 factor, ECF subfamily